MDGIRRDDAQRFVKYRMSSEIRIAAAIATISCHTDKGLCAAVDLVAGEDMAEGCAVGEESQLGVQRIPREPCLLNQI